MQLASNKAAWDTNLSCNSTYSTWTSSVASNERYPINCVTWYDVDAFCIWDGGFLPSEAEWNYAEAGGSDQRVYAWSNPPTSTSIDCSYANYEKNSAFCPSTGPNDVGSESPKGDGRWGQADLTGNVWEWNLDWFAMPYATPCDNCAYLSVFSNSGKVIRGGSFKTTASGMLSAPRAYSQPSNPVDYIGARCARSP